MNNWLGLDFLVAPLTQDQVHLHGQHDAWLVALAYLVAVSACYVTLVFAERIGQTRTMARRRAWSLMGALSFGFGVWGMHFIAMLAFTVPTRVHYDLFVTLASLLIVVLAGLMAMPALSQPDLTLGQRLKAGLVLSVGIVLMHYTGMAAAHTEAVVLYRPAPFLLSIAIAVGASFAALQLIQIFRRHYTGIYRWLRMATALVMGLAIAAMHFTGMWSMVLIAPAQAEGPLQGASNSWQLGVGIAIIALLLVIGGLGAAWADRQLQRKENDLERVNSLVGQLDEARASLQQAAHYDPLTDLHNRRSFNQAFAEILDRHAQQNRSLAVMFLDIDHFKRINDSLGHDAGDQLLVAMAKIIRDAVRDGDLVARFGGDEFCILASLAGPDEARHLAQRILERLRNPITIGSRPLVMTTSIGISLYPRDGGCCEELLKSADLALYLSKGNGRNTYSFFDETLREKISLQLELEAELREALVEERGLQLYYQPILDVASGHLDKAEALIRWDHPRLGLLAPNFFLGVAEANGFIEELDAWVLKRACRDLADLTAAGLTDLRIAVNCSALSLSNDALPGQIAWRLDDHRLSPRRLELEVTENALVKNVQPTAELLQRIRDLGVTVSIDDFGTGYSSLAYLKRLPIDTVKIDRSFITGLVEGNADHQIVQAIIGMARPLKLKVTAEGVEHLEQLRLLCALGCDFIQGYHISRPVPLAQVPEVIARYASGVCPLEADAEAGADALALAKALG